LADFATESTGGVLTGFLAEEEHLDRRGMLRLGAWAAATVGAIVLAVLANQSSLRLRRDELAAVDLTRQAQQIQSVARESQTEARRLASAIDTLNSDRDRMYTRLSTLEQGLDSVTGAIARQNAATVTSPAVAAPAASTAPSAASASDVPASPTPQAVADGAAPAPAPKATTGSVPLIGPVATTALVTGKQATEAKRPEPANALAAAVAPDPSNSPATTASAPLVAAKSMMGPPDAAASKLIEQEPAKSDAKNDVKDDAKTAAVKASPPTASPATPIAAGPIAPAAPAPEAVAAAPVTDKPVADKSAPEKAAAHAAPQAPPQLAVNRTEFGVDVGGANSVGGLRALWRGLLKSRSNAPLAALQPIIVIKEGSNGLGMQLRLVAGPLTDAAAAAKICATMVENERPCATTVYDGQRLAMKADEAMGSTGSISQRNSSEKSEMPASEKSAAEKPVAPKSGRQVWRRRSYAKRAAAAVEEPVKKPESTTASTLSSFFSRR
jgi:hypothetical protein